MRREPSTRELDGLVDQYLKEEIYYRGSVFSLDEDDTTRRRMLQKLTFLTEDLAVSDTPREARAVSQRQQRKLSTTRAL